MKVLEAKNVCPKCHLSVKGQYCSKCLSDFIFRRKPEEMSQNEKSIDLVEWKKALIPDSLVRKRAGELTHYGVRPSQIRGHKTFRFLVNKLKHSKI